MLYPAHLLVTAFVLGAFLCWAGLMVWVIRSGLFEKGSEDVKYAVFDEGESRAGKGRASGR